MAIVAKNGDVLLFPSLAKKQIVQIFCHTMSVPISQEIPLRKVSNLFAELRRRRVLQLLGIYIIGAWAVLQVADLAFQSWGLPDAALQFIWIGALLLFPAALVFSWRYDITTHGIVRTPRVAGEADLSLRSSDRLILLGLLAFAAAASFVVVEEILRTPSPETAFEYDAQDIDPNAVAVLPFSIAGTAEDTVFFADGIHDDLLTTLANISSLKVISRTSVMQYRDTARNMRQIARELGALNILEGRVQRAGDNVRINVQLIDATTDEHIWAQIYDRALSIENIFEIQSEIAQTIAEQLAKNISPIERRRLNQQPTDNLDAFNAYIKGKHRFDRSSFEALWDSEKLFRKAIELDPNYALAHTALAATYAMLAATGAITVEEMLEKGQVYIDRAVELDPTSGYGQAVLADYKYALGHDDFEEVIRQALELSPNSVEVHDIYAGILRKLNRNEEALGITERALELDPLSASLFHDLGRSHVALGQFPEAHTAFERISQIDPGNPYAAHGAALATILGGQLVEGAFWSDESIIIDPEDFENSSTSAIIYGSIGNMTMAQERLDEALTLGPREPYPLAVQAYLFTLQGDRDKAVSVARTALANKVEDRWRSHELLLRVLRDAALKSGEYDEAVAWYRQLIPTAFEDTPVIDSGNITKAAHAAHLLKVAGQDEQADRMLLEVIRKYDEIYTLGSANYPLGIANVDAYISLGREQEALTALRKLVDENWRMIWRWNTEVNPTHDSLRDNAEYQALIKEIKDDLAEQVRTFEESRQ
jgi:TolB-like protein/Tfp pilus assembly protein PilF